MVVVTLALEMLLMTLIGVFVRKMNIVGKEFSGQLTAFVMKILLPMLTFHSVRSAVAFSVEAMANCAIVVVVGLAVILLSLGLGQLFYCLGGKNGSGRILRYAMTFSHFSFMGIPVIEALFGEQGTFYYVFFIIPLRFMYYTLSEPLMTPPDRALKRRGLQASIKGMLLNPALIGVGLGLVFWITGWELPTAIDYCIRQCASLSSPLGLILCGLLLGDYDLKVLLNPQYIKIPLVRLLLMPGLFLFFSKGLSALGVEKLICDIVVVYAALPVASLLPAYTVQYDPDQENHFIAAGSCVISTLLSTLTIPVWFLLI